MTILKARGITKWFGRNQVLHGIDLDIRRGEFVAVMGPSGSGKSTLMHVVSGMDEPTSGTAELDGVELTALTQRQLAKLRLTQMGFVFQQVHLLKNLTLLDNIVLPAFLARLAPRDELVSRARELMARMGVADLADRDISQASGGQLQRIGICRALINDPPVLFCDEPTGALDSAAATDVMDILTDLHRQGTTVVMITHDAQVAAHAQRVLHIVDGRITAELAPGPLDPADPDALTLRSQEVTRMTQAEPVYV